MPYLARHALQGFSSPDALLLIVFKACSRPQWIEGGMAAKTELEGASTAATYFTHYPSSLPAAMFFGGPFVKTKSE